MLLAHELYRFYHVGDDETAALRGVSLALQPGQFLALMGPSGSGKSTLLACLAGLDEPDGGYVELMGSRLTRRPEASRATLRARHLGILMQSGNLFGHLTVDGNIQLAMQLARRDNLARRDDLLELMELSHRRLARPSELSGGEAARAGLAVALAAQPQILLADEPTAEVDAITEAHILDHLRSHCQAGGAVLVATHSQRVAAHADCVLMLGDGRFDHA